MASHHKPWIRIDADMDRSEKILGLPSDAARWTWMRVLMAAKTARRMGVFADIRSMRYLIGTTERLILTFLDADLLHRWPTDCAECCAWYAGKADEGELIVHDYLVMQSEYRGVGVPPRATKDPKSGAARTRAWRLRNAVFERDRHTCRYCGRSDYPRDWLVAEHVDPDGLDSMENLVTACRSCNSRKGNRTPEAAGMTILPEFGRDDVTDRDASRGMSDTSQRHVTSRALSPSPSMSPSLPREEEPYQVAIPPEAEDLRAIAEDLTGQPNVLANVWGDSLGARAVRLARKHGIPAVEREWRRIAAEEGGMPELRQLVFGADEALNRIRRTATTTESAEERDARELAELRARAARNIAAGATR